MMEKADPAQKLYTRMRFWEFPDQYVIEPTDGSAGSCLAINLSVPPGSMMQTPPYLTEGDMPVYVTMKKMETEFSGLLGVAERTPGLYFSYDINITLR
ncbi:phosphoinositide phosphatase family protein [Actinidia rufa]|uniref:Phosphoinositide phosphatase family protein n=1 Tax=Actinidia rufa TaxID=165716 RepID=A0A7J0EMW7_9ERIC|nr:phosphoinositide phosphatase family protein [Actinidia rufa]